MMGIGIVAAEATASDIIVVKPGACVRSCAGICQPIWAPLVAGDRFTASAGQTVGSGQTQRSRRQFRRARSFSCCEAAGRRWPVVAWPRSPADGRGAGADERGAGAVPDGVAAGAGGAPAWPATFGRGCCEVARPKRSPAPTGGAGGQGAPSLGRGAGGTPRSAGAYGSPVWGAGGPPARKLAGFRRLPHRDLPEPLPPCWAVPGPAPASALWSGRMTGMGVVAALTTAWAISLVYPGSWRPGAGGSSSGRAGRSGRRNSVMEGQIVGSAQLQCSRGQFSRASSLPRSLSRPAAPCRCAAVGAPGRGAGGTGNSWPATGGRCGGTPPGPVSAGCTGRSALVSAVSRSAAMAGRSALV